MDICFFFKPFFMFGRGLNQAGSNYTKFGSDIDGEASGDYFGYSVRISANGSALIVCATRRF
jgi:hypothetical protein